MVDREDFWTKTRISHRINSPSLGYRLVNPLAIIRALIIFFCIFVNHVGGPGWDVTVISPDSHDPSIWHSCIMHDSVKNHRSGFMIDASELYEWDFSNKTFPCEDISPVRTCLYWFYPPNHHEWAGSLSVLNGLSSNKLRCPRINDRSSSSC